MKHFVIYDASGAILRVGRAPDITIQAGAGEFVIEGIANPNIQVVSGGQIVDKPQADLDAINRAARLSQLGAERQARLLQTDIELLPDRPAKPSIVDYREALRALDLRAETVVFPTIAGDLAAQKADFIADINHVSGRLRARRLITTSQGQEMIYLAKEREAKSWLTSTDPDIKNHSFLSSEIGVTAASADQIAQLWLNLAVQWRTLASLIENVRLTAINAIEAANSPSDAQAALDGFRQKITAIGGAI